MITKVNPRARLNWQYWTIGGWGQPTAASINFKSSGGIRSLSPGVSTEWIPSQGNWYIKGWLYEGHGSSSYQVYYKSPQLFGAFFSVGQAYSSISHRSVHDADGKSQTGVIRTYFATIEICISILLLYKSGEQTIRKASLFADDQSYGWEQRDNKGLAVLSLRFEESWVCYSWIWRT